MNFKYSNAQAIQGLCLISKILSVSALVCFVTIVAQEPLNLVLVVDGGHDAAMARVVDRATDQGCIVIATTPVLHHTNAKIGKFKDTSKWRSYCDDKKNFALFIPSSERRSFWDMGLNKEVWGKQIQPDQIDAIFKDVSTKERIIDVAWLEQFNALWANAAVPKNIFLEGHGYTNTHIAGIPAHLFRSVATNIARQETEAHAEGMLVSGGDLIDILQRINTKFLFMVSCYSGGINSLVMQKDMQNSAGELPFVTVLASVGEIVATTHDTENMKGLLDMVTKFFAQSAPPLYLGKPIKTTRQLIKLPLPNKITFTDVIKSYFGKTPIDPENIPSVSIPGAGFFRALDLDNQLIITMTTLRAYRIQKAIEAKLSIEPQEQEVIRKARELQQRIAQLAETKTAQGARKKLQEKLRKQLSEKYAVVKGQEKAIIEKKLLAAKADEFHDIAVDPSMKTILVYPSDLHDIQLNIQGNEVPSCISKITGNAQHIIGGLMASQADLYKILQGFLPAKLFAITSDAGKFSLRAKQAWFIHNVVSADDGGLNLSAQKPLELSGLVIFNTVKADEGYYMPCAVIACSVNGNYYFAATELPLSKELIKWQSIEREQYNTVLNYIATQSLATDERALYVASAGAENKATQTSAFIDFMQALGFSAEQVNLETYVLPPSLSLLWHQQGALFKLMELKQELYKREAAKVDIVQIRTKINAQLGVLLEQQNIEPVLRFIENLIEEMKDSRIRNVKLSLLLMAGKQLLNKGYVDKAVSVAERLLTNKFFQGGEVNRFFKLFLDANADQALAIIENFLASADKNLPETKNAIKYLIPSILPPFLREQGYTKKIKSLIQQSVNAGMPLDSLLENAISAEYLDQIAEELARDLGGKAKEQEVMQYIEREKLDRDAWMGKTPGEVAASEISDRLLEISPHNFLIRSSFTALEAWIKAKRYDNVFAVLDSLLKMDAEAGEDSARGRYEARIINLLAIDPQTIAEVQTRIGDLINSSNPEDQLKGQQVMLQLIKMKAETFAEPFFELCRAHKKLELLPQELLPERLQLSPEELQIKNWLSDQDEVENNQKNIVDYLASLMPSNFTTPISGTTQKRVDQLIEMITARPWVLVGYLSSAIANLIKDENSIKRTQGIWLCLLFAQQTGRFDTIRDIIENLLFNDANDQLKIIVQELKKRGFDQIVEEVLLRISDWNGELADEIALLLADE